MNQQERITALYWIETARPLDQAAALIAGEQSSGTFVRLPGETDELLARHGAEVVEIRQTGESDTPALPGAATPSAGGVYRQAEVSISFPVGNIGPSLVNLHTMLAGNLFELSPFSGLRLLDFDVPESFLAGCPGPAFGIAGTRQVSGVAEGPLIGTIIKPSVGLSPAQTASYAAEMVGAGLDFIKDDELIADPPYSRVAERVRRVMDAIRDNNTRAHGEPIYAVNISGTPAEMARNLDAVHEARGNCVMVNLLSTGLAGVLDLRARCDLPIHGHRNGWGAISRCSALGFDYTAWHKFWKLAGVDHLHVNGLRNKFCEPDESVLRSARAVQAPVCGHHQAMPVFSSGQWVGQVGDTFRRLGNADLLYVCGGGIWAHPMGPAEGVAALREAWAAAMQGKDPADLRASSNRIRAAYETFEKK